MGSRIQASDAVDRRRHFGARKNEPNLVEQPVAGSHETAFFQRDGGRPTVRLESRFVDRTSLGVLVEP
jgi:hypothetical protein